MVARKSVFFCLFMMCLLVAVEARNASLEQGLEAYRAQDWANASLFLRQAVAESEDSGGPDARYLLIMSEMYAGDYQAAINDSDSFLDDFPSDALSAHVQYQRGRALHHLGQNDESVLALSDFCHENPRSRMYASALYWIAECFYDEYNFDTARGFYEQIVARYPDDTKVVDARFKLDAIAQREREQKLLTLLRQTGEDYLNYKEYSERQAREYEAQDMVALRRQLNEANARILELEAEEAARVRAAQEAAAHMEAEAALYEAAARDVEEYDARSVVEDDASLAEEARRRGITEEELLQLKIRAAQLQRILDERSSSSKGM